MLGPLLQERSIDAMYVKCHNAHVISTHHSLGGLITISFLDGSIGISLMTNAKARLVRLSRCFKKLRIKFILDSNLEAGVS